MKSSFLLSISISVLVLGLASCTIDSGGARRASSSKNILRLGVFHKGNFIPDEKPLGPKNIRDLREVALSLPIWESGWKSSEDWVYKNSKNGIHVGKWTNPADGAQHAVTLRRLNVSPEGRTRIEVYHPVLKILTPSGGWYDPWVAVLERREGGWFVETATKAEGQN